jgi:hypothetical protein
MDFREVDGECVRAGLLHLLDPLFERGFERFNGA